MPSSRRDSDPLPDTADVAVIGAGFGGLATALRLSELGARVVLFESLNYPGGCASTFTREGYRFESGATLFSGFGRGQLFRKWIDDYELDVSIDWLDPVVELRTPTDRMEVTPDRNALVKSFTEIPGAPAEAIRRFFDRQKDVADTLWQLMDEPELLPPFGVREALRHAARLPAYARLAPLMGRSLGWLTRRMGVHGVDRLDNYLAALCQITVQCPPDEAEALFALSTMDYYFRGTGHVRGGIGELAWGLVEAIRRAGGKVVLPNDVRGLTQEGRLWRIGTRRGEVRATAVVANVLPQNLWLLTNRAPGELPVVDRLAREVESGWGACMLYRVVDAPDDASEEPHHLELVTDPEAPFVEGNHVFCSFSGARDGDRAGPGQRTVTISTHVPVAKLRERSLDAQGVYIEGVQARMRRTLAATAPEWEPSVVREMTASPRTFQRFTSRYVGYVGGIPRRTGLHNYRGFTPRQVLPRLFLVGDTVFPGQSTLATAIGGVKLAPSVAATL